MVGVFFKQKVHTATVHDKDDGLLLPKNTPALASLCYDTDSRGKSSLLLEILNVSSGMLAMGEYLKSVWLQTVELL